MKRYKLTFTEKQINYILRGLSFFEGIGEFVDGQSKEDAEQERYAFELRNKILEKIKEQ